MLGFLVCVVVIAISLLIISKLPTGVEVDSPWIALIAGAIIGAFNGIWSLFPGWLRAANAIILVLCFDQYESAMCDGYTINIEFREGFFVPRISLQSS